MQHDESSTSESFWNGLARVRDIAFVVAIFLYFSGFGYRYYYLDQFGVAGTLDATKLFAIFVGSYNVFVWLAASYLPGLIACIAVCFLLIALDIYVRRHAWRLRATRNLISDEGRRLLPVLIAVGTMAIFPILNYGAYHAAVGAAADKRNNDSRFLTVDLTPKQLSASQKVETQAESESQKKLARVLGGPNLVLLTETDDRYYILLQGKPGAVYAVRKDEARLVTITLP